MLGVVSNHLQGPASYSPWTKSGPPDVFVIKFYWHTALPIHLHIAYVCFHPAMAELSSCTETMWPAKALKVGK